jgi:hypothetical protein
MTMYVAAFVDPTDTMFLEASSQGINGTYTTLEWWNASRDARWSDTTKSDDAWRAWSVRIPEELASDTMHMRLRFRSNASRQSDGFYIDDIRFDVVSSVDDDQQRVVEVWPNPAGTEASMTLLTDDLVQRVSLISSNGESMPLAWTQAGRTVRLDMRSIAAGVYTIIATSGSTTMRSTLSVVR